MTVHPHDAAAADQRRQSEVVVDPATPGSDTPPVAGVRASVRRLVDGLIAAEPWLVPPCALILLAAPNGLAWPAAALGSLPTLGRIVTTGRPWRSTVFDLPLLFLAIGALAGGYASLVREDAIVRLTGLLAALLIFGLVREHAHGERGLRALVIGMLVGATVACAALLVLVGPFLLLDHVPGLPALIGAVDRWQLGPWFVDQDWLLQRYRFRASGVGALADVGLALAVATLIGLRSRAGRVAAALTVPFFGLVLLVADNRGSMLAGAMTLGALAVVWRRRLLPLLPVGAIVAVLAIAFGPVDRGLGLKTLAERFWFWSNSLYLAREVPLTGAGLGLGSVQLVYRGYFLPTYPPFSHAHNIYLQALLESGVLGLAGLIGIGCGVLWLAWRAPTLASDRWVVAARLAGVGVALAMLTTGLTEIVLLTTLGGVIALAGLGLLAATVSRAPTPAPDVGDGPSTTAAVTTARRRWPGWGAAGAMPRRRAVVGAAVVAVLAIGLAITGFGSSLGARLLLSLATADLNRAAFSESIGRQQRSDALDRAVSLLRTASAMNESDPIVQRNLALALAESDDARRGRAAADRAKALTSPSNRDDLFQLGRAYVELGVLGEAIRAWQNAQAAPQLLQLGGKLVRARNFDQATNAYLAAAQVDPESHGAYAGIVAVGRGRGLTVDETVAGLQPLQQPGSPTEYAAQLEVARTYRATGRLRDAAAALDRAGEVGSDADLAFETGLLLMEIGRADSAEPLFESAARDLPYDSESWLWLARSQAALGRHDEAVASIRAGLARLDPSGQFAPPAPPLPETAAVRAVEIKRAERAPMLGVLGASLARLGRASEALPALDEAIAARPDDPSLPAIREEVWKAQAGAPPNLITNPGFDWDGDWFVRGADWYTRPTLTTLLDDRLPLADGQLKLVLTPSAPRVIVQEIPGIEPGRRYRLSARMRAEGLGPGNAMVSLFYPSSPFEAVGGGSIASKDWTTLEWEDALPPSADHALIAVIHFNQLAPPGAVLWIDEVSLVPA